eukprot:ANDGO_07990.mRNA.1 Putative fructokinase
MGLLAAVEGGGTTFRVSVFRSASEEFVESVVIPTQDPVDTVSHVVAVLQRHVPLDGIGVACFGPLDLSTGTITTTPKPKWANFPIVDSIRSAFPDVPLMYDTDVNAPALSEAAAFGVSSCCYVTVGTGIGVGVCLGGVPVHGLVHPEGGHVYMPLHDLDVKSGYLGVCPFHKGCFEGMASAPSIAKRLGLQIGDLDRLADDHAVWDAVAHYLAQACVSMTLFLSPQKIVLGGGVLKRRILFDKIRKETFRLLNGYVQHPALASEDAMKTYISAPFHGDNAGLWGARFLAEKAANLAL